MTKRSFEHPSRINQKAFRFEWKTNLLKSFINVWFKLSTTTLFVCSFCLQFFDEFSHSCAREPCQKLISIKSTSDSIKLLLLVIDLIVRVCCAAAKKDEKFDEKINRENMFLRWIKLRNEVKHWREAKHNENLIRFLSLRGLWNVWRRWISMERVITF